MSGSAWRVLRKYCSKLKGVMNQFFSDPVTFIPLENKFWYVTYCLGVAPFKISIQGGKYKLVKQEIGLYNLGPVLVNSLLMFSALIARFYFRKPSSDLETLAVFVPSLLAILGAIFGQGRMLLRQELFIECLDILDDLTGSMVRRGVYTIMKYTFYLTQAIFLYVVFGCFSYIALSWVDLNAAFIELVTYILPLLIVYVNIIRLTAGFFNLYLLLAVTNRDLKCYSAADEADDSPSCVVSLNDCPLLDENLEYVSHLIDDVTRVVELMEKLSQEFWMICILINYAQIAFGVFFICYPSAASDISIHAMHFINMLCILAMMGICTASYMSDLEMQNMILSICGIHLSYMNYETSNTKNSLFLFFFHCSLRVGKDKFFPIKLSYILQHAGMYTFFATFLVQHFGK